MPSSSIIVIGAGVTGLTTASLLRSRIPKDTPITIVAAETPTTASPTADYASMWAGAHYRPIYPLNTPQLQAEHKLAMHTAEIMRRISRDHPEAGVAEMEGLDIFQKAPKEILALKTGDLYAYPGDGFRVLEKHELPADAEWGGSYQTYTVNVGVYCNYLLENFLAGGGKIIQQRLSSAADAFDFAHREGLGKPQLVVNCSGRNFDQDSEMKIIRGQTVLVRQMYHKTITWQVMDSTFPVFLIPRPCKGGTIVGGTKEPGDWEAKPRADTKQKLLDRCVESFPDFVDDASKFEVIKENVGRRPWRQGGYRFEIEEVGPERTIVHGYGAGGRGYELSWGAAGKIVDLVQEVGSGRARL